MAHVPGIAPVGFVVEIACTAVACAAKYIYLASRKAFRVLYRRSVARLRVRASRPVACLAMDTRFTWLDGKLCIERYRSG